MLDIRFHPESIGSRAKLPEPPDPTSAVVSQAKDFVEDETLETLAGKLVGLTDAQAKIAIAPFVDKWLRVRGVVVNVTVNEPGFDTLVSLYCADPQRMIALFFPREDQRPLELNKSDGLLAQGQIMKVASGGGVALQNCEVLRIIPKAELEADIASAKDQPKGAPTPPPEIDKRPNLSGPEARRFSEFALAAWPNISEREAHRRAVALYYDKKVPRDWFWNIFRTIRGPKNPGKVPKSTN
ncbi:MAG: hypothetical protein E6G94_00745 [Alphaproteobacteria bacterium]|nr:MAG: hypothetical protein E6G94_00745 [Alphaproteobacteria bacterium]